MKRLIIILTGLIMFSSGYSQQQGTYFSLTSGIQFGSNQNVLGTQSILDNSLNPVTIKNFYNSLGKGAVLAFTAGLLTPRNIGLELQIEYLSGSNATLHSLSTSGNNSKLYEAYVRQLRLIPSVIFVNPIGEKSQLRASVGLIVSGINTMYMTKTSLVPGIEEIINTKTNFTFSPGVKASIGYNYQIGNTSYFFLSVVTNAMTSRTNNLKTTSWTIDGDDVLSSQNIIDKEVNYEDQLNDQSNNPQLNPATDPNRPAEELRESINLSGWGFQLGFSFNL